MSAKQAGLGTFTKTDLIDALSKRVCFTRRTAKLFTAQFFQTIAEILAGGEWIKFSGVGKFVLRDKATRPGRNPKTKAAVPVSARRVVTFRPSQLFKQKLTELNRLYKESQRQLEHEKFEVVCELLEKSVSQLTLLAEAPTQIPA